MKLIRPLIERVYLDIESKRIGTVAPTPAFRQLLECAVRKSGSTAFVLSQEETEQLRVWSWCVR